MGVNTYKCPICKKYHTFERTSVVSKSEKCLRVAINMSLLHYREENVDVVANEETEQLDVIYHSDNNSFPLVSGVCKVSDIAKDRVKEIACEYGIGYCF